VDDDGTADGSQPYRIVLGKAQSADPNYNVIDPPDVNATNSDNDSAGITLKNQDGLTTKENGAMASFQIVLNSRPTADVTIAISSSNAQRGYRHPRVDQVHRHQLGCASNDHDYRRQRRHCRW
jgi:hypothetical protein